MKNDNAQKAIAANVAALGDILKHAYEAVADAETALALGAQNQAIGGILDLDRRLEDALALLRAALALHRAGGRS